MASEADIEQWEREWRQSRQQRDFFGVREESRPASTLNAGNAPGREDGSVVSFRPESLPVVSRPRSAGGSIAKEEVDRAYIRSMTSSTVNELLMRDGALRDNYKALMDTGKPQSFIERVRNKAREDDDGRVATSVLKDDEGWLVHKYESDLKAARQDCREARNRVNKLMSKIKELERDLQDQKDATSAMKQKADALEHEKLDRERALGAGKHGGNGKSASLEETRERCEELLRECSLKDQVISLLQTENKSSKLVHESRAQDLEGKMLKLEEKLAASAKSRDEERTLAEKMRSGLQAEVAALTRRVENATGAREREEAMRKAIEDSAKLEKARFEADRLEHEQTVKNLEAELDTAKRAKRDTDEELVRAQRDAALSRTELQASARELLVATKGADVALKDAIKGREEVNKELERVRGDLVLVERELENKKRQVILGEREVQLLTQELDAVRGELVQVVADKHSLEAQVRRHAEEAEAWATPRSSNSELRTRVEGAERDVERAEEDAQEAMGTGGKGGAGRQGGGGGGRGESREVSTEVERLRMEKDEAVCVLLKRAEVLEQAMAMLQVQLGDAAERPASGKTHAAEHAGAKRASLGATPAASEYSTPRGGEELKSDAMAEKLATLQGEMLLLKRELAASNERLVEERRARVQLEEQTISIKLAAAGLEEEAAQAGEAMKKERRAAEEGRGNEREARLLEERDIALACAEALERELAALQRDLAALRAQRLVETEGGEDVGGGRSSGKRISWNLSDESGPSGSAINTDRSEHHESVPALGVVHDSVSKELAMMAERIVGLEKEREELHEGARWRAEQMTHIRNQLKAELKVREEMESSLQKLHETNAAMLGMILHAMKLLGSGKIDEATAALQKTISYMELVETMW